MHVVALLPPSLLSHLQRVLADPDPDRVPHVVHAAADWSDVAQRVRREPVDVLVVDPLADGTSRVAEVARIREHDAGLPVVVYTTFSPAVARSVVELARHGVHQVVLHRFDDEPGRLRELMEQQPGVRLGDDVLGRLALPLGRLPASVQRAVERLFRHPRKVAAEGLAAAAGVSVRSLYRQMEAAGLASPAVLVRAAKLLRAYSLLRGTRASADEVSSKMEFGSRQLFARHVRLAFGTTVAELRRHVEPAELVERLTAMIHPDPGAARPDGGGGGGGDRSADELALDEEPDMDAREQ